MRVLFGHFGSDSDISGVTTWLLKLIAALKRAGWEVDCILQHFGRNRELSQTYCEGKKLGVRYHWIRGHGYTDQVAQQTLKIIAALNPDIFLPQVLVGFHYAALRAAEDGLPFVYTMHSDDPLYWGLLDELYAQGFRGPVICVSEFLRKRVTETYAGVDCRAIAYGVDCDSKAPAHQAKPFRVCYCGRLEEEQKRITSVVSAMIHLCRRFESVECQIIGDGSARSKVDAMIREAGLGGRIQLLGRLPSEIARGRLAECHVLLLLSEYEGLPLVVLEAMSMGVVPICRPINSGIPELVRNEETGFLVSNGNSEVEAIVGRLINDQKLWTAVGSAGRELIERQYSVGACHRAWTELMMERVKQGSSVPMTSEGWQSLPSINPKLLNYDFRTPPLIKRVYRRMRRFVVERAA